MTTIEHIRGERRVTNSLYWQSAAMAVAAWGFYLYFKTPDWWPICLGAYSGIVLTLCAIEITASRVPGQGQGRPRALPAETQWHSVSCELPARAYPALPQAEEAHERSVDWFARERQ